MRLKKIDISDYRQLKKIELSMDNNITVVAGANNSGKTSLVELFNTVFSGGKFSYSDLPVRDCKNWHNHIRPFILNIFQQNNKEEHLTEIDKLIFPNSDNENTSHVVVPSIRINIQIDYEDSDDIRNFADYLMDFDPEKHSFFFIYEYSIDRDLFKKNLENKYDKLSSRIKNFNDNETNKIDTVISSIYAASLKEKAFYTDSNYLTIQSINLQDFKSLFNYYNIFANRILDDSSADKNKILSKNILGIASNNIEWKQKISQLTDQILQPIQDANIKEIIQNSSLTPLKDALQAISNTNGGNTGNLSLDMDISEESINRLINSVLCAKYQLDDCQLGESSQGLGYSNLIYIHLQIEKYKQLCDPLKVNFFIIEEPEAHMHPQMQNVFTHYLFDHYKNTQNITQCLVTTHSNEVIRGAKQLSKLRVLRREDQFNCNLFDLNKFHTSLENNQDLIKFYDFFFTINFPDIIFSDKVLMYEGDTERMYINRLLSLDKFKQLKQQYISFVQVGGAYAFKYKALIDFLKIKSVILTDIDYKKDANNIRSIKQSNTTNTTINQFSKQDLGEKPTISQLYNWQESLDQDGNKKIIINKLIYLAFQGKNDYYARTLEEAMLAKLYQFSVVDNKTKKEWQNYKKNDQLKYTIPQKEKLSIRDIVKSTSNNKTDFMYSVLLNDKHETMLPNYIKEALEWLME